MVMWFVEILIIVLAVVAAYFFIQRHSFNGEKRETERRVPIVPQSGTSFRERPADIQKCVSKQDIQYKLAKAEQIVEAKVQQSKILVAEAQREGYIRSSTRWLDRFNDVVEVSNTLNQNLIIENQQRLQHDRFHRYNDLWYRSMLMGNMAHEDYVSAKASLEEIGHVLVAIGKGTVSVSRIQKTNLYNIKDAFKEARDILLKRVQSINAETAKMRDKIRDECGERGKRWYAERMRNR